MVNRKYTTDGYGYNYAIWDTFITEKFSKQLKHLGNMQPYGQVEIFRSPKGRWMAFHNTNYYDIRIVDLETCEPVFENFYSYFDKDKTNQVYKHHVNFTTYVPTYFVDNFTTDGKKSLYLVKTYGFDCVEDMENFDFNDLFSIPIAFNAWTIWGADFEFYVDVLDLREIDDGKLKMFKGAGFTLVSTATHVRQYINNNPYIYANFVGKEAPDVNEHFIAHFSVLEKKSNMTLEFGINSKEKFSFYDNSKDLRETYSLHDKPPYKMET